MFSVETGLIVETGQMSAAETGQMSAVETGRMLTGPKSRKWHEMGPEWSPGLKNPPK